MNNTPPSVRCPQCQAEVPMPAVAPVSCWRRWRVPLIVAGVLLLACLGLGYRYQGQIRTVLQFVDGETGSRSLSVTVLALAVFVVLCLVTWLLLPVFLAMVWLDLRRRCEASACCRCPGPPAADSEPSAAPPARGGA